MAASLATPSIDRLVNGASIGVRVGWGLGLALCLVMLASFGGCQARPSVEWRPTAEEPPHEKATLTTAEQRQVRGVLRDLSRDHQPSPDRQPEPIGWSDIRRVVAAACSDVFMAVAQVRTVDETTRIYHIRTVDEKPAKLTVTRIGEGLTDFRAEATVGVFEDDFERAAELVEQFGNHLLMLRNRRYAAIGQ
jgi:hypothetical protein